MVELETPPNGAFFDFGDEVSWDVEVTDPEEETVDPQAVEVQPALGHDDHAHPLVASRGFTGSTVTSVGGHAADENIFYAIDARYSDTAAPTARTRSWAPTRSVIFPKLRQAEWFDAKSGTATLAPGRDAAGGGQVVVGKDGAWLHFEPVSFHQIETYNLRVQANAAGGTIELRKGSPTGDVVGTAEVPATGLQYRDIAVDVSEVAQRDDGPLPRLHRVGTTSSSTSWRPSARASRRPPRRVVAITAPADGDKLDPGAEVDGPRPTPPTPTARSPRSSSSPATRRSARTPPRRTPPTWTTPAEEGLYEITAKATDDEGNTTRRGSCRCRWASSSATWCPSPTSTVTSSGSAPAVPHHRCGRQRLAGHRPVLDALPAGRR